MKRIGLLIGLVVFAAIHLIPWDVTPTARHAAAMTALMVVWWMTEALPIHLTALVPLAVIPLLPAFATRPIDQETAILSRLLEWTGLADGPLYQAARAISPYFDSNTFLFLGGMAIAAAMQKWNLHKRIALHVIALVGAGAARIVVGFVLATAFISLWISNTATAVMMMPIGLAVIRQLEGDGPRLKHFGLAVMLAIAYAANVGGIGTKIGTGPNAIFCGAATALGRDVGFVEFLWIGLPFVALFLPLVAAVLARIGRRDTIGARDVIGDQLRGLGPMSRGERIVLAAFLLAAGLWVAGKPIADALGERGSTAVDAMTAMFVTLLLFLTGTLDAPAFRKIPWSVLVLLGGSFAMADAVGGSGLSAWMGERMAVMASWPPWAALLAASAATVLLSAVASNTATTNVMLTLVRGALAGPLALPAMATCTIAASCDFALPAGTPPNAIVFGSGYVTLPQMVRIGALLDVAAAVLAAAWGYVGLRAML